MLKDAIPALKLPKGLRLRKLNPFADGPHDHGLYLDENDLAVGRRAPWIFLPAEVVPLPEWPEIRKKLIDTILRATGR